MELKSYYAQNENGAIVPGAYVYLYEKGTTTPVTGLRAADGYDLTNPFQSDNNGLIQLAAPDGVYDLRVTSAGMDRTITVQFLDAAEAMATIKDSADRAEQARDELENSLAVHHILIYGQSLSIGSAGADARVVSADSYPRASMFNGGPRPLIDSNPNNDNFLLDARTIESLEPLQENVFQNFGETFCTGIAAANQTKYLLLSCTGQGSLTYATLKRGNSHWANTMLAASFGARHIASNGKGYRPGVTVWKHGEADAAAGTTRSEYIGFMKELRDDLNACVSAAVGKSNLTIPLLLDQMSNTGYGPTGSDIIRAQLDSSKQHSGIYCAGPNYWLNFVDNAHMTSESYRIYGEKLGIIIGRLLRGETWQPCHVTDVHRSGTTITVTIHVPEGELEIDTTRVSDPGDYGFEYFDGTLTPVAINSVTLANGNQVVIEIAADTAGKLRYALQDFGNKIGRTLGARGNIRDQATALAKFDGTPLDNWLCADEWEVA